MRMLVPALPALLLAGCMAEPPQPGAAAALDAAALAIELEGRTAGPPQRCISAREVRGNRAAGDALLFEGAGGNLWVNRPPAGCGPLRDGRALSVRMTGTQLCAGDVAVTIDPLTGAEFGACALGEFTPWRRAR